MKFKIFFFLFFLLIIVSIYLVAELYIPAKISSSGKFFVVQKNQSALEIAENLKREGLIESKFAFLFYVWLKGDLARLKAGRYYFESGENIIRVADKIVKGEIIKLSITIPEGLNINQIEKRFSEKMRKVDLSSFKIGDFKEKYHFLNQVPNNAKLEGFLFPDTYQFGLGESDLKIADRMLSNFWNKIPSIVKRKIETDHKNIFEMVIMASLIEKEVKSLKDKRIVSGILWKRLENNMPLQVDATITYITGKKSTKVSLSETKIDSPYNTYKYRGMPPGPICNPGLESIYAAVFPEKSPYWYYLSSTKGETIFSETLEKHKLAKAIYLK